MGKKGKKKPTEGGEQAPASQGTQPGPSGGPQGGTGDAQQKEKTQPQQSAGAEQSGGRQQPGKGKKQKQPKTDAVQESGPSHGGEGSQQHGLPQQRGQQRVLLQGAPGQQAGQPQERSLEKQRGPPEKPMQQMGPPPTQAGAPQQRGPIQHQKQWGGRQQQGGGAHPPGFTPSPQSGPSSHQGDLRQAAPQKQPPGRGATPRGDQPPGRGATPRGDQPPGRGATPRGDQPPGRGATPRGDGGQQRTPDPNKELAAGIDKMQIRVDKGDENIVSKQRVAPGKKGRKIPIETNHLSLNLGKLAWAYHYDVAIDPDKPKKFMRPVMESFRKKKFPTRHPAFDGMKNLYTPTPLHPDLSTVFEDKVTIEDGDRPKEYTVQVKFANKVDMSPLRECLKQAVTPREAMQVVDIVLRMAPVQTCLPVGRSFFIKPPRIIDLGQGMEMYNGFYQSAIRGWKPLLNVDVAHKAFPKNIPVIDSLAELLSDYRTVVTRDQLRQLNDWQKETLRKYISTLRIEYLIPGHPGSKKSYRVNGLGESAERAEFTHEGTRMTIVEYFQRFKNYRLRYPQLPTLHVGSLQRVDKILLPLELCTILEGQAINRKMTELQTSKMIKHAATSTDVRKDKIFHGIRQAGFNNNPTVREFGISVGDEFQKLEARVLQPPDLAYHDRHVRVNKGVWRNGTFLKGVTINKWTIANTARWPPRPDDYKKMEDLLMRSARDVGITMAGPATQPFVNVEGRQEYKDILRYFENQRNKGFDVIFVIVPDSGPQYSYVKKAAEIAVGCLTQCVKSGTVGRKMNPQTAVNILLKVNSKLNGVNHSLAVKPPIMRRPVMIMGADVTHPGPGSTGVPSVAAVTASHDPKAFNYNICWRLQDPRLEIIGDLENIVYEQLAFFYKKTNCKPEAILFFRDGVSEGQFEEVMNTEIRAIRAACKRVQKVDYEPKITFLVVQKRHHTRMFPVNRADSEDKNCNVPAGTCVDTDITHPFMQDFYLVSHASIQGVAKPTKYCTLHDDNNMDNDQIEELSYYLCHMFTRCNRSVSYPAPTYYAHLAAARAKVYIENDRVNLANLEQEFRRYQIKDEIQKDKPMFFV